MSFVGRFIVLCPLWRGSLYCVLCEEVHCTVSFVERFIVLCPLWRGSLYCVLCGEVHCTVSLLGRVHYQRLHCTFTYAYVYCICSNKSPGPLFPSGRF